MTQTQLTDLTKRCYEAAKANGWHEQQRSQNEFILLIQSEMFECFEAYRKNKYAKDVIEVDSTAAKFDNLHLAFDKTFFEIHVKDTFEDELADTAIRIFDFMGFLNETPERFNIAVSNGIFIPSLTQFNVFATSLLNNSIDGKKLCYLLEIVLEIAQVHNIDILRHIDLKLEYNKTRGVRHGGKIL